MCDRRCSRHQTTLTLEDPLQAVRSATIAPGLDTGSDAEATPKRQGGLDMDRNPFLPNLDANRPLPPSVILIFGALVTGLALAGFALLFL